MASGLYGNVQNPTQGTLAPAPKKKSFADQFGFTKKPGSFTSDLYHQSQQPGFDASSANLVNNAGNQVATIGGNGQLQFIEPGQRKSEFATNANKVSGDLAMNGTKEAQGFTFNDVPTGFDQAQSGLFNTANSLLGAGATAQQDQQTAQAELADLQRKALSPASSMDPAERQQYQDMADERRAQLETRFNPGGDISNLFARQGASDISSLANSGVLDSTTGVNAMAKRDTDLGALYNSLIGGADEQSRQDLINAQNRNAGTATSFGQTQGQQASNEGQLGSQYGQLGLSGLSAAGDLGLKNQEQQGQFQLAQTGQRLLGNQLNLQNIQSLLNQGLNRKAVKQGMSYQDQVMQMLTDPNFSWLGAAGGLFSGTGLGNAISGGMG